MTKRYMHDPYNDNNLIDYYSIIFNTLEFACDIHQINEKSQTKRKLPTVFIAPKTGLFFES